MSTPQTEHPSPAAWRAAASFGALAPGERALVLAMLARETRDDLVGRGVIGRRKGNDTVTIRLGE